jgi:hypothetical protein
VINPGGLTDANGEPLDENAIVITYTYDGDANLDGRINADDYFRIDSGFLSQPAKPHYAEGDFNYDGTINADDYFLIDSAFLGQGAPQAVSIPRNATAEDAATQAPTTNDSPTTRKRKARERVILRDVLQ